MDKGKIVQILKGYATDSNGKNETSIDYCRIDDLATDLYLLFARDAIENLKPTKDLAMEDDDELLPEVIAFFKKFPDYEDSISNIQRYFKLGYFRASKIFRQLSCT